MKRLVLLSLLLTACAALPLRLPVQDVQVPVQSSAGQICYAELSESLPAGVRRARYESTARYTPAPGGAAPVTVQLFGRTSAPAAGLCAPRGEEDLELSARYALAPGSPKRIVAGEGARARALADLLRAERSWLGVAVEGGVPPGGLVLLSEGVLMLSF